MTAFGDGTFGKGFNIKTEITNGKCPLCLTKGVLVSIYDNIYRCMNCGADLEQHVNGKISYLPAIVAPEGTKPFVREWRDDDGSN